MIIDSIRDRLLTLPPDTVVRTGHGGTTTIGDEAPHFEEWVSRGHQPVTSCKIAGKKCHFCVEC
ncbi:hypothetical protein Airi02_071430 [Actinoallomurus iriomotensis]|uniref:Zn-dependent hydrolase n=1 Tax=Actinoallomurus iriomotensis TaxID=478107 RepID=A0A9W6W394_9ACTN|nr:hypothetical protein Airi02_071430 [Actinoallomurus iriomotensis]